MSEPARPRSSRADLRMRALACVLDVASVTVFVAIGRASHGEDQSAFALTLLPFLSAVLIGRSLASAAGRASALWPVGVIVWACAVVLGLLLRVAAGGGFAVSFAVVTAVVLAVFLFGWRAIALLVVRARRARVRAT